MRGSKLTKASNSNLETGLKATHAQGVNNISFGLLSVKQRKKEVTDESPETQHIVTCASFQHLLIKALLQ